MRSVSLRGGDQLPGLVGRSAELADFSELLGRARQGHGAALVIVGDAGIGKSRLLTDYLDLARSAGCLLLGAAGAAIDTERPFGVVIDAFGVEVGPVGGPADGLARLVGLEHSDRPAGWANQRPELRYRIVEAVVERFERLAADRCVVVAVDDLQWADPSSGLALHALARRVASMPALVVATTRYPVGGSAHEVLLESLRRAGAVEITLPALAPDEVSVLAGELLGARPGPNLRAKLAGAEGNPFFVTAVLEALVADNVITVHAGEAEAADVSMPPSLRLTLLRALQFLPSSTRQVLHSAAALGSTFSLADLGAACGVDPLEAWGELGPAVAAGLVREEGDRLAFRHDLVREAIYLDLPVAARAELHARLARALAGAGRDAITVATHAALGPGGPDPWAVDCLRRGAHEAAARAPELAVGFLRRAVELAPAHSPGRDELRVELLMALHWSARLEEAVALGAELLSGPATSGLSGPARLGLGWTLYAAGRVVEAAAIFETGAADQSLPEVDRARLAGFGGFAVGAAFGPAEQVDDLIRQALEGGQRCADDLAACMGEAALAGLAHRAGRHTEAAVVASNLVARYGSGSSDEVRGLPHQMLLALCLIDADRFTEADDALASGLRVSEELGAAWNLAMYHSSYAVRHFAAGDWDDALAEVDGVLTLAADTGAAFGSICALAIRALVAGQRDDLAVASAAVDAALAALAATGPEYRADWAGWAAALLAEARGDLAGAFATLSEVWSACQGAGLVSELPWLGPDLVRLAVAAGDRALASAVAEAVEACPDRGVVASLAGAALRCRGLAEADPEILLEAAAAYRRGPRRFDLAVTLAEAADALAAGGQIEGARAAIFEAVEIFEALGAAAPLARAEATLRRLGVRRGRRGVRARATTGWQSLTPSERHVVELVGEGLTNTDIAARLCISRRTVESHVAHALVKLGEPSRFALAVAARTQLRPPR